MEDHIDQSTSEFGDQKGPHMRHWRSGTASAPPLVSVLSDVDPSGCIEVDRTGAGRVRGPLARPCDHEPFIEAPGSHMTGASS